MSGVATEHNRTGPAERPTPVLLSAETLAERLGFSERTIWRLRSAGKLPSPLKIGGSVRWRADEIDAWIQSGCPSADTRRRR